MDEKCHSACPTVGLCDNTVCDHLPIILRYFTPFPSHLYKFLALALILCKPLVSLAGVHSLGRAEWDHLFWQQCQS